MLRFAVSLLLSLAVGASGKSDCSAKAVWPDGTELQRECVVEGEGKSSKGSGGSPNKIHAEFKWLKDTRWHWNNWRDVIFKADGSFLAPAEGCERDGNPKCRWSADEDRVYVKFGGAGLHSLDVGSDQASMSGTRDSDGDPCHATRVQ